MSEQPSYPYAIIKSGGKQYSVRSGARIKVERLDGEVGSKVELGDVLFGAKSSDSLVFGGKELSNAKVVATIAAQTKGPKKIIFKKRRRQGYKKKQGHRQQLTELVVDEISLPS